MDVEYGVQSLFSIYLPVRLRVGGTRADDRRRDLYRLGVQGGREAAYADQARVGGTKFRFALRLETRQRGLS